MDEDKNPYRVVPFGWFELVKQLL